MKYQTFFPASLLLLCTLTAFVSCQNKDGGTTPTEITVKKISDGIQLSCGEKNEIVPPKGDPAKSVTLKYKDENSGEYICSLKVPNENSEEVPKIYVKFRTCDNCVELDESAIAGLVVGNVVATIVLGVAVYLIASKTQTAPTTSNKKSSDRQHLVSNEVSNRGASGNDHYQRLNLKGGQRDTYDIISSRR